MKFDRNTVIGFTLLAILLIGYVYINSKDRKKYEEQKNEQAAIKQRAEDSIARLRKPAEDSAKHKADSIANAATAIAFKQSGDTTEKTYTAENNLVRVTFSNKGGVVKQVELKNFKGLDSGWVKMGGTSFDKISYPISSGTGSNANTANTSDLFFTRMDSSTAADGSKTISFTLQLDSSNTAITHEYVVKKDSYLVDFNIKVKGAERILPGGHINLQWQYAAAQQESSLNYEWQNTQIGYVKDGSFDYHSAFKRSSKDFNDVVKWVGIRQRFFMGALVAKNNFASGSRIEWTKPADSLKAVVYSNASLRINLPGGAEQAVPLSIYYGPSDYKTLKKYDLNFENIVNLGQGMYAFVRPLNKYVIIPVFNLLKGLTSNMGIVIILLTLFIRLLISPLTYTSYLSGAKMKALRPEIEGLKAKYGDDRQAMSMEQMKLFREAGVNPLGGCIPALLQIPIFFALFSFFNSCVDLRGESFLWAADLSAPDKLINLTNVPVLGYLFGGHLSLFNITACITSFLISWYSMSMSPDQSNPMLKYMPYIFPVFLLFFFNRLPAGLTWYYTVSNLITLGLQFIIQTYIIDHNKILARIEQNRKKPKTKSKWQERMEQMQEQQKKLRDMQQKNKR